MINIYIKNRKENNFVKWIICFILYFTSEVLFGSRTSRGDLGSFSILYLFLNCSLRLSRILLENSGFLMELGLAPDGNSFFFLNEKAELMSMKPGDDPSVLWKFHLEQLMISTYKDLGVFVLQQVGSTYIYNLRQNESGAYEKIEFSLEVGIPNQTRVSITQAKVESESSFLCASADGMLWKLGRNTGKDEWMTDNIWQKKEEITKDAHSSETQSESSDSSYWTSTIELTTRQHQKIHSGPVTALHVLPEWLVTASKDRDVKLWERSSMQLLGLFRCEGAVNCVDPHLSANSGLQLAVGDAQGNVYFLSWE